MAITKEFLHEIKTLSNVDKLIQGLRYRGCGFVGDTFRMENDRAEVRRTVQIRSTGSGGTLELESDEQVKYFERLKGSKCRLSGPLARRSKSDAVKPAYVTEKLLLPGSPGWMDPTDDELELGFTFDGFGKIADRRLTEYRGETYRTLQLSVIGETHRITGIDPELFEKIPDSGVLAVVGSFRSKLVDTQYGKVNDMYLQLEMVYECPKVGPSGNDQKPEVKPDPGKTA